MSRPWQMGLIFGACLAVMLAAMGWTSIKVVQLDRAEAVARAQAGLEENVRLALWRMDSILTPLIAQESARPYFSYNPFYPAERAYTKMFAEIQPDDVRLPSPLLASTAPHVFIHFQMEPDGRITSPQVPSGRMRELAEGGYTTRERIERAEGLLARLQSMLDYRGLRAALPLTAASTKTTVVTSGLPETLHSPAPEQPIRSSIEGAKRALAYEQAALSSWMTTDGCEICADIRQGMMRPMWVRDALILARKVSVNRTEYIQGCQLDWPAIRQGLIANVSDLLPRADLQPIRLENADKPTRMLAALPVQLIPGDVPVEAVAEVSPLRISLLLAWICVVLAAVAVGVLLYAAVVLSERRGAFVSAVTHELRTPLTTLRMYAEMLAEQMVPDEPTRRKYLGTMRVEADRLAHLIDNVLSYSRLEGNRAGAHIRTLRLGDLLDAIQPRLVERARQAGMEVVIPADHCDLAVRVDPGAVEQILFNLVDNACKYANTATDRGIHLTVGPGSASVVVRVRDHGPGIGPGDAHRLFRPFSKSARDAASSAPGVGLGLALSRRLARSMGGDLRLADPNERGTVFELSLPAAS